MNVQSIEALQAEGTLDTLTLIDVRTAPEYNALHADGAINLPLDTFSDDTLAALKCSGPVALICQSGTRAKTGCQKLSNQDGIVIIEGGTQAWEAANLPVVRGKKTIGVERQVRIIAGLMVFTGVCVGYFIHPAGFLVSGFVGLGLTFAGITDTCGMAIMLSSCPWNKS